jgi:hypothetical protein
MHQAAEARAMQSKAEGRWSHIMCETGYDPRWKADRELGCQNTATLHMVRTSPTVRASEHVPCAPSEPASQEPGLDPTSAWTMERGTISGQAARCQRPVARVPPKLLVEKVLHGTHTSQPGITQQGILLDGQAFSLEAIRLAHWTGKPSKGKFTAVQ